MTSSHAEGALVMELLATGPNAHGYGQLRDGRAFAFRVRNRKARLEIYGPAAAGIPLPEDVELVAERSTGKMNLDSHRSLTVLIRNMAASAAPEQVLPERTLRAYFLRLDSIIHEWTDSDAQEAAEKPHFTLRGMLARLFAPAA